MLVDNITFANVNMVSTTTIVRVLKKYTIRMKQLYTVPFERNRERVKETVCPGKMSVQLPNRVHTVMHNVNYCKTVCNLE